MDGFLGFLLLMIYLFAAASGSKKKKANRKQRQAERRNRDVAFGDAFADAKGVSDAAPRMQSAEPEKAKTTTADAAHGDKDCREMRLHLHEVSQMELRAAGEGVDPCHAGEALAPEEPDATNAFEQSEADASNELARDVLRGVIMSEILTRPCDRVALKRNRRSVG